MKQISINVLTFRKGEKCDPLCIENCAPAQLNSILSLAKPYDSITIDFVEIELNAQGMPIKD